MIKNRLNSETSEARAIITESPVPATDDDVAPIKPPSSSWEKVPCIATQNAYSLCGTTVTRLAAIKPFSTFRQVFLMFACPDS